MPPSAGTRSDPILARHETLLEVAESIASHRQLSTLFADLSRCLNRLVAFDFIALTLADPKEKVVRLHILETDRPVKVLIAQPIPYGDTPTVIALETRKPYYVPDISEESRFPIIREMLRGNGI